MWRTPKLHFVKAVILRFLFSSCLHVVPPSCHSPENVNVHAARPREIGSTREHNSHHDMLLTCAHGNVILVSFSATFAHFSNLSETPRN